MPFSFSDSDTDPGTERRWMLILLSVAVVLFFAGLNTEVLDGRDERRFARVAMEMRVADGSFFALRVQGALYPDKPPLMMWAQRAFFEIIGDVTPLGARLPMFFSAIGALAFAYFTFRRTGGPQLALISTALLMISFRFLWGGHTARLDMTMCTFVFGSFWASARLLFPYRGEPAAGLGVALLAWAMAGLAVLAKGPGPIVWLLALAGFAVWKRDWSVIARHRPLLGIPVLLAVVAIWFVPAVHYGGHDYLSPLIGIHVKERLVGEVRHGEPFFYFWHKILYDTAPTGLLLIAAMWYLWRRRDWRALDGAIMFAILWLFLGLLFFSLPRGKRTVYIMPLFPALAFLVGYLLQQAMNAPRELAGRLVRGHLLALLPLLVIGGTLLPWVFREGVLDPLYPEAPEWFRVVLMLVVVGGASTSLAWALRWQVGRSLVAVFATLAAAYTLYFGVFTPLTLNDTVPREIRDKLVRDFPQGFELRTYSASEHYTFKIPQPAPELTDYSNVRRWMELSPSNLIITTQGRYDKVVARDGAPPPWEELGRWHSKMRGETVLLLRARETRPLAPGEQFEEIRRGSKTLQRFEQEQQRERETGNEDG